LVCGTALRRIEELQEELRALKRQLVAGENEGRRGLGGLWSGETVDEEDFEATESSLFENA